MQSPLQPTSAELPGWFADPFSEWGRRFPGRRAYGYLCTYAPLELLHAAGFSPVRLTQSSGPVSLAEAHLPSFSCALARTVTEQMLRGGLDFLEGVLFTHTCDTLQCLADIWRMAAPRFHVLTLSMSTVMGGAADKAYLLTELQRLADRLETTYGCRVTREGLLASMALYNTQRRLLSELYERSSHVSALQAWSLVQAGMLMPVEEHVALLQRFLQDLPGQAELVGRGPALVVVGAILDDPLIPQLIDELGGRLVGDDLCSGSRYWDTLVDEEREPFDALTERYIRRAPCPAKRVAGQSRPQRLLDLVRARGAQGVVFAQLKFCDPHAFDYVPLSRALDAANVPHLLLETDVGVSAGQVRTRLQAFLEMLG
jgi:benzoyl-CoA reductase/2-hydroxyglutaryl-CoA dehydratase subunit BcrC/BadD/HgdB